MKLKRRVAFILLTVLMLAAIAAWMMVIGRGHTVYLDNKTLEDYQGQEYKAYERVVVTVKGEEVAKLASSSPSAAGSPASWASGSAVKPSGLARTSK